MSKDIFNRATEIIKNTEDAYYDYAFDDDDEIRELLDELVEILEKLDDKLNRIGRE